jgi:hypothetical protein
VSRSQWTSAASRDAAMSTECTCVRMRA